MLAKNRSSESGSPPGRQRQSNLRRTQLPPPVPRKARREKKTVAAAPEARPENWRDPPRADIGTYRGELEGS